LELRDRDSGQVAADEMLAAVLETVAHPVWVVDRDGLIHYANPAAVAALDGTITLNGAAGSGVRL
jgi:PAS domain-containing protein